MRILLDPTAVADGGAATTKAAPDLVNLVLAELDKRNAKPTTETKATEAKATETKTAVKTEEAPDLRKWLKDLEEKVTARDAQDREKAATDERTQLKAKVAELIGKGDLKSVEEVITKLEASLNEKVEKKDSQVKLLGDRLAVAAKKSALVEALSGIEFASPLAAKDAIAKFDGLLDVKLDAQGEAQVFEKGTNKPVSDAVKARLESGEFDHFLKAGARKGGVGNGKTSQASGNASAPKDIVEWIQQGVENQKAEAKARGLSTRTSLLGP